ncbi:MAG: hypothetical protein AAF916_07245 [Planctomycetota bacterium]
MSEDQAAATQTFRWTPIQLALLGVFLVVASMFAGFLTVNLIDQAADRGEVLIPGGGYLAYMPSSLIFLLGVVFTTVGTLRCALYGTDGQGPGVAAFKQQRKTLDQITERLLISETAKKVAYRVEDIRLLRETIEADIQRKDFDAALVLVKILADTYGQIEESETFRERIENGRSEQQEERVGHEVAKLDEYLNRDDFPRAARQASRIKRLFPTVDSVQEIDQLVRQAREVHKHDLERQFLEAAKMDDVDTAMKKLKELDKYLQPDEASQFEEVARGVIGKQRDNLGVQFKLAVHDKEWLNSVRIGEQIIREFPNTRMADEVRGMLDLLRERAAGQQAAAV